MFSLYDRRGEHDNFSRSLPLKNLPADFDIFFKLTGGSRQGDTGNSSKSSSFKYRSSSFPDNLEHRQTEANKKVSNLFPLCSALIRALAEADYGSRLLLSFSILNVAALNMVQIMAGTADSVRLRTDQTISLLPAVRLSLPFISVRSNTKSTLSESLVLPIRDLRFQRLPSRLVHPLVMWKGCRLPGETAEETDNRNELLFLFLLSASSLSPFHPLHLAASPSFPRLDMSHQIPSATPHQQASSLQDLVRESLAELPDSDFSTFRSLLKELLLSLPEDPHNELNHDIAPTYHVLNRLSGEDWERLMETTSGYRRQTESTTVAYVICQTLDMLRQDIASQNWASFVSFRSLSFHRIHSDFSNFADISKDYSRQATRMSPSGLICA